LDAASKRSGSDLFIVDNSDSEWKVRDYLREWAQISDRFDIATGYFEVGALLALDGQWQKLDKLRVLMGDEVTKRTKKALLAGINAVESALDASLEKEKEQNDFLAGVPGIVEAIRMRQIECRVYANLFRSRWRELVTAFLKLGAMSYGGPAIMGIIQTELQEKRGWLSRERFLEGLALVNMLPGGVVTQLCIFIGYDRAGWRGGVLAGFCFILPSASWRYRCCTWRRMRRPMRSPFSCWC